MMERRGFVAGLLAFLVPFGGSAEAKPISHAVIKTGKGRKYSAGPMGKDRVAYVIPEDAIIEIVEYRQNGIVVTSKYDKGRLVSREQVVYMTRDALPAYSEVKVSL